MNLYKMPTAICSLCIVTLTMIALSSRMTDAQDAGGPKEMNAMLKPWTGPYGGVPPWHLVRPEEFVAAFEAAIASSQKEIDEIANHSESPTFENTLMALESAGRPLERLQTLFGVHSSNLNVGPI